jgi:cytochrome c553
LRCPDFCSRLKATPFGVAFFLSLNFVPMTMLRTLRFILAAALASAALPALSDKPLKPPAKLALCAACHGKDGNSTDPQYPILAGQNWRYIYLELQDFQAGRRTDPVMSPMAAGLSKADMTALGNWYAAQKYKPTGFKTDPDKVKLGLAKADETLCDMCHLGHLSGQNEIPRVAGQHYAYVKKQLLDFKAHRRTNDGGNMTSVAGTLSDTDIDNVAQYAASLQQ